MAVVRANTTAHVSQSEQVVEGTLWEDDHPIVRAHPEFFDADLMKNAIRTPGKGAPSLEQTTAAPGEKRSTTRTSTEGDSTPKSE